MTPLEALAVDYVRARVEENKVKRDYSTLVEQVPETRDYDDEELIRLSELKICCRNISIGLEAAMISHVRAAYESELNSPSR